MPKRGEGKAKLRVKQRSGDAKVASPDALGNTADVQIQPTLTPSMPTLVIPAHGRGALNSGGTPGNNGGRPTNEFKALMRLLADRAARALAVSEILEDPTNELYLPAAKWAAEQGYGKPAQQVEHTGRDGGPVRVLFVRE